MASIVWPTSLPQRLRRDGYQEQLAEGTIRTQMDEGPDKVRKLPTFDYDEVSGSVLVTDAQWQTLRTFYRTTTKGGSLAFEWVDMTDTDTTVTYRFKSPPVAGTHQHSQLLLVRLQLEKAQ